MIMKKDQEKATKNKRITTIKRIEAAKQEGRQTDPYQS